MDVVTPFGGGPMIPGAPPPPPPIYDPLAPPGSPWTSGGMPSGYSGSSSSSGCGCKSKMKKRNKVYSQNQLTKMTPIVQSWFDTALQQPVDPRILIANAEFGGIQGAFVRTTAFGATTWGTNAFAYSGTPSCVSLHTDDALAVAEAAQWTFAHQIINVSASNPPALSKIAFMRAGEEYQMQVDIDLGGSNHPDLLLSFRDNAAVPGDFVSGSTGAIPAIKFTGTLTGVKTLKITLKMTGTFVMGLKSLSGGTHSMFEMEWVVVG